MLKTFERRLQCNNNSFFDDNQIQSLNHSVRKSPTKKQSPMKRPRFEAEASDERVAARIKFGKRMVCDSDDDCVSDE